MKRSLKDAAKKGQNDVCRILAKEVVQSRRAVSKMYASKAQINSVMMSMQNQLGKKKSKFYSVRNGAVIFSHCAIVWFAAEEY